MNVVELQNKSNETIIQKIWLPVGTLYYNQTDISEDIKKYFYGTWERAKGFFAVAVDEDDSDFSEGKTGGEKTHILTLHEIPQHNHVINAGDSNAAGYDNMNLRGKSYSGGATGHNTGWAGGNGAHNNLPPYRAFFAWIRVS